MSGQTGVPGDWQPATEACLGRADGFPWTRVRGLEGGIAVQVSTFSLVSEVYTEELTALSRASRPGGIVVLFVPPNPRHKCPPWGLASGSKEMSPHQGPQVKNGP